MTANLITLCRLFLLFFILFILEYQGFYGHVGAFFMTLVVIILDGVDGLVARRRQETSDFGSVLDIVVDRVIENCFWIYFACKGRLTFWIPVIVLTRGVLTDGIRSVALAKGMTAFGEKTLQKSRIGKALVNSRVSRGLYGLSKVLAFLSLIILDSLSFPESEALFPPLWHPVAVWWTYTLVYVAVVLCVARGLPVLFEGLTFFSVKRLSQES